MVSLTDLTTGPKIFKTNFGPKWGPRLWRVFFCFIIFAMFTAALSQIGGFGKAIFEGAHDMLPGSKIAQNPPPISSPTAPTMGNDNTIYSAPIPRSMGSGNTVVGPTDSRGNAIINQGGTAIGSGACADSTSVAIGANANAGCATRK